MVCSGYVGGESPSDERARGKSLNWLWPLPGRQVGRSAGGDLSGSQLHSNGLLRSTILDFGTLL